MNLDSLILGANGRPLFKVPFDHTHSVIEAKSYFVVIGWHIEGRECEPCMYVIAKTGDLRRGVWGICLSSIAAYCRFKSDGTPDGAPSPYAFREALRACPILGKQGLDIEVYELVDIVINNASALIACPPAPRAARLDGREALVEVTMKDENGRTTREAVL